MLYEKKFQDFIHISERKKKITSSPQTCLWS